MECSRNSRNLGGYPMQNATDSSVSTHVDSFVPMHRQGDDGGLAVVRIKPLGAGGGGGEASAVEGEIGAVHVSDEGLSVTIGPSYATVGRKHYRYPKHVIPPELGQGELYDMFMPSRVHAFLSGSNVNIMVHGQTGSGKTHTMFGPPGLMAQAAAGEFGTCLCPDYGLCPRGLLHIVHELDDLRQTTSLKYELTVSAVELTAMQGNLDMFIKAKPRSANTVSSSGKYHDGVCIDKTMKPPVLHGMLELSIQDAGSLLHVFEAISTRNTANTGLNESSSRSHCFVFLTLYSWDARREQIRINRFQFIDLAGSERMKEAHHGVVDWRSGNLGTIEGLCTNMALLILSQRARELKTARKAGKKREELVAQSYKTQLDPDLLPLLSETLTGSALSLIVVCVSSAPDNALQSVNSLDFGAVFSCLDVRANDAPWLPINDFKGRAAKQMRRVLEKFVM